MTDTAAKRQSAVDIGLPWRGIEPFPDSALSAGDRQTVAFQYSGILAGGVVEPVAGTRLLQFTENRFRSRLWATNRNRQ